METIVVKIKGLRSAACVSSIEYKLQQLEYELTYTLIQLHLVVYQ